MYHLSSLLIFGIPLLYYYINLNSSITVFLAGIYIFLLVFQLEFLVFLLEFLFGIQCNSLGNFFDKLVILSAILLPIKSPVATAVF